MKSRIASSLAIVVVAGLFVMAGWVWFGYDWTVRLDPASVELLCTVESDRAGGQNAMVGFRNLSEKRTVLVVRSERLRGPFAVQLASLDRKKELPRVDADEFPAPLRDVVLKLRPGSTQTWSSSLKPLFGALEPGRYRLRVTYDTESARRRGASWYLQMEPDLGSLPPVMADFEVKARPAGEPAPKRGAGRPVTPADQPGAAAPGPAPVPE